jgi:pyridinium-3,5-biscarboxylic acid mononucleotide sulfurtransferase
MGVQPQPAAKLSYPRSAAEKENELRLLMRQLGRVLVAYSGGVDSTYLAFIASSELGEGATCVMGLSESVPAYQREEAEAAARSGGFSFITLETSELSDTNYAANPVNRCYFCKNELYTKLRAFATDVSAEHILDGTNSDDLADHRPGRAAADELSVRSPLAELGFSKEDIRERSRAHRLVSSEKPSSPCLASRIAYGVPVTVERLSQVERAEAVMRSHGFVEFRVRVHRDLARIEISPADFPKILDEAVLAGVRKGLKLLGFSYITLDLEGFRSGSMNKNVQNGTFEDRKRIVELESF